MPADTADFILTTPDDDHVLIRGVASERDARIAAVDSGIPADVVAASKVRRIPDHAQVVPVY